MTAKLSSTFRSAGILALGVMLLGMGDAIIGAVGVMVTATQIYLLDSAGAGTTIPLAQAQAMDDRQRLLGFIQLGVKLPMGILFLVWVYRANRNARALGAEAMTFSPGWSVGSFFVPLANLVMPYLVMREIWQASISTCKNGWRQALVSPVLGVWWVMEILVGICQYSRYGYLQGKGPNAKAIRGVDLWLDSQLSYSWGLLIEDLLGIAATVLTLVVVLNITELQDRRAATRTEVDVGPRRVVA